MLTADLVSNVKPKDIPEYVKARALKEAKNNCTPIGIIYDPVYNSYYYVTEDYLIYRKYKPIAIMYQIFSERLSANKS